MIRRLAPAKINLYLRVVGKRPDGYHEIETIFERINLCDELTFESRPHDITLTGDESSLSCGDDNIVVRAAQLLQEVSGARQGAAIHLTKRIPIAAGLGGGSSDAAAALAGLNALWGLALDRAALLALGMRLGADVPFFLHDVPFAIGRGRGDLCEPISDAPPFAHVLIVPDERISTQEAFEAFDANVLTSTSSSSSMVRHALSNGSLSELAKGLWNDFEPEANRRCPVTTRLQSQLRTFGCSGVLVSGSGPSVFGLCEDSTQAQRIAAQVEATKQPGWRCWSVQTYQPSERTALRT